MPNSSVSTPSQPFPTPFPADGFAPGLSLLTAIGFVVVTIIGAMGSGLVVAALFGGRSTLLPTHGITTQMLVVQFVVYALVVTYAAFALPALAHASLSRLGLRPAAAREILTGLVGAIGMWIAVSLVSLAQQPFIRHPHEQEAVSLLMRAKPSLALALLVAVTVVFAPFVEELVFRGFLFNALRARLPFWTAAIVSGVIFAASHGDVLFILPLAAGGVVLSYVYASTESLVASMTTHATFNAINLVLILVAPHAAK